MLVIPAPETEGKWKSSAQSTLHRETLPQKKPDGNYPWGKVLSRVTTHNGSKGRCFILRGQALEQITGIR